jgi:hypothetical protein
MALTVAEDLVALRQRASDSERRLTNIEAAIKRIEAALARPEPKPVPTPTPPKWAGPGDAYGMNYTGAPSPPEMSGAGSGFGYSLAKNTRPDGSWKDPSGVWRDAGGNMLRPARPTPLGPERTEAHEEAIRHADKLFEKETKQ